ncbi:MAG: MFS transporter [Thermoplasmata archaeon]|nr:MFS transporter [Thermoplasmata archaeon]
MAPTPASPSPGDGYWSLLRNRNFRFVFLSGSAGDTGYAAYSIAILWIAYRVSGSLAVAGLVLFVEFGVYSMSFLVGPVVDRVRDLRSVLLVGYPTQALLAFVVGLLQSEGRLTTPTLLLLVIALSVVWDFTWTATQAILPRVVSGDALFRANGLSGAVSGGNQIAGFAAGAGLLLIVGPAGATFLYAALNVVAALLAIPIRAVSDSTPSAGYLEEMAQGWRYLAAGEGRPRLQLVTYATAQGFFSAAPALLIALLASREFADPVSSYGILFTAFGIGGVVGSLGLGQVNPRRHLTALLVGVGVGEGVLVLAAVEVAPALLASIAAWFWVGVFDVGFYTAYVVYFQATAPAPMVARALTNAYFPRGGARAVGGLVVGVLAVTLSPVALGSLVGGVFVAIAVLGPALLPAVRRLGF